MWRVIYWVSPRTPEGGQAGKADTPPFTHTQLSLATFKGGIRDENIFL
ncbi:phosphinothricin acetyltransferase [Capnocytophaga sp. oral taxon 324]